ncbi:MAG: hypothetical protein CMJ83_19585 [Planctomycetes bacterium]|nr:hypothetical protein [Planctomycetota bacterium]
MAHHHCTPSRSLTVALGLVLILGAALPAQKNWEDEKYGYSINTLKDWEAVPPQPTDKYIVAKWVSKRRIRELPAEMHVYVFNRKAAAPTTGPLDGREIPAALREYFQKMGAKKSYADWIASDRGRAGMSLKKGKKLRVKSPAAAKLKAGLMYTTSRPSGYVRGAERMGDFLVVVGVITTEDIEYAVECFCSKQAERKMKARFQSVVKSFKLLKKRPDLAKSEEKPAAGKGEGYDRTIETARDEARRVARENAKRNPGWWYLETKRYMIVTNVPRKKKPFIKTLGTRLEAIRDLYEKDFPTAKPLTAVSIVRVCKDHKTYSDYGGPGGSAGYWYSPAKELVFYKEAGDKRTPFAVLSHEAFHQYIYYACGELSPHSWFNEGYGDYYSGAHISGSRVLKVNPFKWRVDTIKKAVRTGTHVPIKDIIRYSQGQYYSNPQVCYAEGWSIVYFLNKGIPKVHPWRQILPTYLKVLQETQDRNKAVDAAFEGVDLDAFEKAWAAFTAKGTKLRK